MKQELKRIETTLHQLANQGFDAKYIGSIFPKSDLSIRQLASASGLSNPVSGHTYSFKLEPKSLQDNLIAPNLPEVAPAPSIDVPTADLSLEETSEVFPPFSVQSESVKAPILPKLKAPNFSSHRNGANPALAMNLLHEIEKVVAGWQEELQQVLRQIQDLYLEGPIVDGWLESHPQAADAKAAPLRHAEVDHLMDYVDEICTPQANVTLQSPRTGYHLCGLDADGKLWSRSCPPEQLPSLSLAISRYHKLRQLLTRKQQLETHLSQLAETLIVVHGHLK